MLGSLVILQPVVWVLEIAFWQIFITPLMWLSDGLESVVQWATGELAFRLIFGFDNQFNWYGLPTAFYGLVGIGAILLLLFFAVNFIGVALSPKTKPETVGKKF